MMFLRFLLVVLSASPCIGVLPTAEITVVSSTSSMRTSRVASESSTATKLYASEASFGRYAPMRYSDNEKSMTFTPKRIPSSNPYLCNEDKSFSVPPSSVLLVPRGLCTFEKKAYLAEKAGAEAIIIHGSLSSRYGVNSTTGNVIFPEDRVDYDCNYGKSFIPKKDIKLPYKESNDYVMKKYGTSQPKCSSKMCLLTGVENGKNETMEACCAWDLHVWLYSDPNITSNSVTIPALFITTQQFDTIVNVLLSSDVQLQLNQRYSPKYNISAILIWALGVFVAALGSYLSASEYYRFIESKSLAKVETSNNIGSNREDMLPLEGHNSSHSSSTSTVNSYSSGPQSEESLDLTVEHALFFILMASGSLLFLFYLKVYNLVKVMYGLGCSGAIAQVLFHPLFQRLNNMFCSHCDLNAPCVTIKKFDIGTLSYLDVISGSCGYILGISWLIVGFSIRHPDTNTFYWIVQDIFGACICINFLSVIRIQNLKVATVLLCVAFFYDIFFVFISPLIFDKSVMITVATSGGPPTADPTWCEKYPDEKDCQGGDPLPMLFTLPRFGDYASGSSMLGLGDIVLPGLLISFCRRLDVAKYMVGLRFEEGCQLKTQSFCDNVTSRNGATSCCCCNGGYFLPCCIAYAVGLLMANAAVYLMQMGQPALLYLVPCCLGITCYIAWMKGELIDLWNGPKVLKTVDDMMNERDEDSSVPRERPIVSAEHHSQINN